MTDTHWVQDRTRSNAVRAYQGAGVTVLVFQGPDHTLQLPPEAARRLASQLVAAANMTEREHLRETQTAT